MGARVANTVRRDPTGRVQSSRHYAQDFAALHPGLFSYLPQGKNGLSTESGLASKPIYKKSHGAGNATAGEPRGGARRILSARLQGAGCKEQSHERLSIYQSAGDFLPGIRDGAPRRGGRHSGGAFSGRLRDTSFLPAPHSARRGVFVFFLDAGAMDPGLYRVLLHAGPGAQVQCNSGGDDRRIAGDSHAGMATGSECEREYSADGGGTHAATGERSGGLRAVRADECGGGAVLLGVRGGAEKQLLASSFQLPR